jgi:hypothetical protein
MDQRPLSSCALAPESEHIKPFAPLAFCRTPGKLDLDPHLGVLPRLETAQLPDPAPLHDGPLQAAGGEPVSILTKPSPRTCRVADRAATDTANIHLETMG